MEHEEYEVMYSLEDRHWWYRGMTVITDGLLARHLGRGESARVLDAGCGTGASSQALTPFGRVTAIDVSAEALRFCREREMGRLARASVQFLPFADQSFDLVTSFDVLYYLGAEKDRDAIAEFARVLDVNGHVLLRLPAYEWLRGRHDRAVHIAHRYTRKELVGKLEDAGFEIVRASYANALLFPVAAAKRLAEPWLAEEEGSDLALGTGPLNGALRAVLSAEGPLVRRWGLPFGLTVLALARKRS